MVMNYAEKYSAQVDEKFKLASMTTAAVNQNYDFTGVNTVNVFSVPTVAMGNYTLTGNSRYGTPDELGNEVQTLTLTRDRSFTFTIDRRSNVDTIMTMEAGRALARQIDEVIVPEVDIYRIAAMGAGAGGTATAAVTASNAYTVFLDGVTSLTENKAPLAGRVAYVSPAFYKFIKLDQAFIKASDLSQDMLLKGQLGMIDGIPLIVVPTSYLPADAAFIITNPIATTSPIKLAEYKIHDNPPGINGWLVEGRVYYDAFVLNNKADAIYMHSIA